MDTDTARSLSDNLATRLEYVPGSSQADRPVVFTITPTEAGTTVLRWEVAGELQPGQSGAVQSLKDGRCST